MINEYISNRIEEIGKAKGWNFEGIECDGTVSFQIDGEHETNYFGQWIDITPSTFEVYDLIWSEEDRTNERVVSSVFESWKEDYLETIMRIRELIKMKKALAEDIKETEKKLGDLISDMEFNLRRAKEIKEEVENG